MKETKKNKISYKKEKSLIKRWFIWYEEKSVWLKLVVTLVMGFFAIIGFWSSLATLDSYYNNLGKGEQLAVKAKEFYQQKDYANAILYSEKAAKIDENINDLKYYYIMALMKNGHTDYSKIYKRLYTGNIEHSNESELALYGHLLAEEGKYREAYNILNEIEDPLLIKTEFYPYYISSYVESIFQTLDYKKSLTKINSLMILINRKLRYEESANTEGLEFLYGGEVNIKITDLMDINLESIKYSNLIMNRIVYEYAQKNQDSINYDNILANGARGFDVFNFSIKDINLDYLFQLNYYIATSSGFNQSHIKNINYCFTKVIDALSRAANSIDYNYKNELVKAKLLLNILCDNQNLDIEKYDIDLNEDIAIDIYLLHPIEEYNISDTLFDKNKITLLTQTNEEKFKNWFKYTINIKKGNYSSNDLFYFKHSKDYGMVPLIFFR